MLDKVLVYAATGMMIFLLVMFVFLMFLGYRNSRVFKYRMELIDKLSEAAKKDIDAGLDPQWRYAEFNKVTYNEMVYRFWKPLDNFYEKNLFN